MAETAQKQQEAPQNATAAFKQLESVEKRLTNFVDNMSKLEKAGKLDTTGQQKLDAAKDILSKTMMLKEQIGQMKDAQAQFETSKKEVDSFLTTVKYSVTSAYENAVTLFGLINKDLKGSADLLNDNQRNSLNLVSNSLTDLNNAVLPMASALDQMSSSLISGSIDKYNAAFDSYVKQIDKADLAMRDLNVSLSVLEHDTEVFKGGTKIATDLAIDGVTMVATGGAISALSKIGKLKRIAEGAQKARAASKVKYTSQVSTASQKVAYGAAEKVASAANSLKSGYVLAEKGITAAAESVMSMAGSAVKNGEVTSTDVLACALVVGPLSSKLEIPGLSKKAAENFEKVYKMAVDGDISFKQFANYVRKEMPGIYKEAKDAATSVDMGKVVKDPESLGAYVKNYYEAPSTVGVGHGARTLVRKAIDNSTKVAVAGIKNGTKNESGDIIAMAETQSE